MIKVGRIFLLLILPRMVVGLPGMVVWTIFWSLLLVLP
jgi:hypothetical protein